MFVVNIGTPEKANRGHNHHSDRSISPNELDNIPDIKDYNSSRDFPSAVKLPQAVERMQPGESADKTDFKKFVSEWADPRVQHHYPIDSVDIHSSSTRPHTKHSLEKTDEPPGSSSVRHRTEQRQQSPYLTISQKPPHMTPLQIGELLFREEDRLENGVISHSQLIRALRSHPDQTKVRYHLFY